MKETEIAIDVDGIQMSRLEKEALDELKERMSGFVDVNDQDDTFMYYRFLVANDFNVDQAEKIFKESLQWRKQNKIDTILKDNNEPEVLKEYFKNTRLGYDKKGNIVNFIPMGRLDSKGLNMSTKLIDLQKAFVKIIETDERDLLKNRKNPKGPYPGYVYIYNLQDLTFANAMDKTGLENIVSILKIFLHYYPERLHNIYVVNVNPIMSFAVSFVKRCFPLKYSQKAIIFTTDDWKEELFKLFDPEIIPAFLGGKKTDPDGNPMCLQTLCQAGKVDEKYYTHKSKNSMADKPGVQKLVLPRASYKEMEFEITVPGSNIEWEFETKNKDVGFGLFYREKTGDEEKIYELVPLLRLNTDEFAEVGVYTCDVAGTYIMLFDNSYSWVRSKEVYYKTAVITPKRKEESVSN